MEFYQDQIDVSHIQSFMVQNFMVQGRLFRGCQENWPEGNYLPTYLVGGLLIQCWHYTLINTIQLLVVGVFLDQQFPCHL